MVGRTMICHKGGLGLMRDGALVTCNFGGPLLHDLSALIELERLATMTTDRRMQGIPRTYLAGLVQPQWIADE